MRTQPLLAKSFAGGGNPPHHALLTNHTREVADSGDALLEILGQRVIENAGLPNSLVKPLTDAARLSFWLHDLGKANSHFLGMIEGQPDTVQILRHETISGLIAMREPIRSWLGSHYELDMLFPALWAAVGHHRKFSADFLSPRTSPSMIVHLGHKDFKSILGNMAQRLGLDIHALGTLSSELTIGSGRGIKCDISAAKAVGDLCEEWEAWSEDHLDPFWARLIGIIKTFVISADVSASAYPHRSDVVKGRPISEYVNQTLSQGLTPTDLDELIWKYAWDQVEDVEARPEKPIGFPPNFELRPFQREVAELEATTPPNAYLTLAVAGCGSGKSLAGYLWARRWCRAWADGGRSNFRLFFTLPTTGTATEHFKDYALSCGVSPTLKSLSHSRSSVDLNFVASETALQEESWEKSDQSKQAEEMLKAQADKIESLDLWGTPLVVGTVDTVLGLMANARRSISSFPTIMQSAIVFDEIHAYDEELFGHLLMFLETFPKIPVLLMTASLPEARCQAIRGLRADLKIVQGPPELEERKRYAKPEVWDEDEIWPLIRRCLEDRSLGKVLWIRNQVGWANRTYQKCFANLADLQPFIGIYHSRFRYKDRTRVHSEVLRRFKRKGEPCVLVATQVAEMSLNLSADLLISDLAPIPALIQRLGRLNRFAMTDYGPSGRVIVCEPPRQNSGQPNPLPYTDAELSRARDWLGQLRAENRRLSQRDLSEVFTQRDAGVVVRLDDARQRAVFLSGRWRTMPASTRGDGSTIAVILQEDFDTCPPDRLRDRAFRRDWLKEHEVSIPIRAEIRGWEVFGYTPIAPRDAIDYGHIDHADRIERTGAKWAARRSSTA